MGKARSWSGFAGFAETIRDHLLRLAAKPGVASSTLMYSLNLSVRQLAFCVLDESRRARAAEQPSAEQMERIAGSLIWFYGTVAYRAAAMDVQRSCEAADRLGWLGLWSLEWISDECALTAAKNIVSLAQYGATKLTGASIHDLASVLLPLRLIKWLARESGRSTVIDRICEMEKELALKLTDAPTLTAETDDLEIEALERIRRGTGLLPFHEVEALLAHLLGQRQRNQPA
jgi:hypothetical protein